MPSSITTKAPGFSSSQYFFSLPYPKLPLAELSDTAFDKKGPPLPPPFHGVLVRGLIVKLLVIITSAKLVVLLIQH